MKNLFRHLSLSLFFAFCLYVGLSVSSFAQATGSTDPNSPSTPPTAQHLTGVMTNEELEKIDPAAAERYRYQGFLQFIHGQEEGEKLLRAEGHIELAEAYRTLLQEKSGLTEEEANKVKQDCR